MALWFLAFLLVLRIGEHRNAQPSEGQPPTWGCDPRLAVRVHRSLSLKSVRLCFWMCANRACPRRSSVCRTFFSPGPLPWLSQNTGSTCSDLSSRLERQPDARTFTADSGNLQRGPRATGTQRKSRSALRLPAGSPAEFPHRVGWPAKPQACTCPHSRGPAVL